MERLLAVIKLGLVAPGGKFPAERELAARLGISRLTLREAIRELQQAGFVDIKRASFMKGRDPKLLLDTEARAVESLYMEASKP